ncbi:uncharacterized protein LOC121375878 isoform X1 [Gigantopelta aegis]|uniref:uncharacterized protein LOC121375878 isoform X1 n=1 Tax=Gigantopelta aegis TaxID=1735272 RepID=UPI001B88849C|nr:uncharacterized protein LOC121375878 isoform X1 [Gigantopelta aegis]
MDASKFNQFSRGQMCVQLSLNASKISQKDATTTNTTNVMHKAADCLSGESSSINQTNKPNTDVNDINSLTPNTQTIPPETNRKVLHIRIQGTTVTELRNDLDIECHESDLELEENDVSNSIWGEASGNSNNSPDVLGDAGLVLDGNTPVKRRRAKKGESDKSTWVRERNKTLRMKGKEYCGQERVEGKYTQTKEVKQRGIRPPCNCHHSKTSTSTKLHCNAFNSNEREIIFNTFWDEMTWDQKKVYVKTLMTASFPKRKTSKQTESRRKTSWTYHLNKGDMLIQVCKQMFLTTLGLGEKMVYGWISQDKEEKDKEMISPGVKRRERLSNDPHRNDVKEFFDNLPKMPSHYCRSTSDKLYLEPVFRNMMELYHVFLGYCKENDIPRDPVKIKTFCNVFQDMNLALFKPKKDQCDICCAHENKNISDEIYQRHIERKDEARREKIQDKDWAEKGNEGHVVTMDLQAVLLSPRVTASAMYYKTKLACHNFTIYDLTSKNVTCYFWHEGQGDLSANTFASCVVDYIKAVDGNKDPFIMYSDGCTYQNRNVYMANALLRLSIDENIVIYQKILEKGHTQMECDSVHSTVEGKLKHRPIYCPANYIDVLHSARPRQPYTVKYLSYDFFKDHRHPWMYNSIRPGSKAGDPVVTDIRVLKYTPDGTIQYKLQYTDEFRDLPRRSRSRLSIEGIQECTVQQLLSGPVPISGTKYNHLQELKSVIPQDYHLFYDSLAHH